MPVDTEPVGHGYRRDLPVAGVQERRPRARRHTVMAVVVVAYALAAAVAAAVPELLPLPRWLALHLLLLGAATNAIMVWSRHFAQALLHSRVAGERGAVVRLAALNAGVLATLLGVGWSYPAVAAVGAALVVAAVLAHVVSLVAMARGTTLAGRLRGVVWYYVAGGLALAVGGTLGGLLGAGAVHSAAGHEAMHAAHAHLNLLGWVGLTVVGTEFMLWPAVLRTRMVDRAPTFARQVLVITVAGLAVAAAGLLVEEHLVAAAGVGGYAAGVGWSLVPFVRTARQRPPHTAAAWALAAGTGWFLVALGLDITGLVRGGDAVESALDRVVPLLAVGFVAQVLVGALTFLLPVTIGGGPAGNRRLTAVLETGWVPRLVAANVGVLLLGLPLPGALHTTGWVLAILALGAFLPLAAVAVAVAVRPDRQPEAADLVAVPAVLVVVAVLSLVATGVWPARPHAAPPGPVVATVDLTEYAVSPGTLTVPAGTRLVLTVRNRGHMTHDLRIEGGPRTDMLAAGQQQTVDFGVVRHDVTAWCTVAGHREAGMSMAIRVGDAPRPAPSPGWRPYDPALRPVAGGREHRLTLHAVERDLEVAPGVRQRMWTFDGTVPAPVLHGRVGDLFTVRLVNDGTTAHSLDFHASRVAPDVAMRPVPPGGSLTYQFRAEHAGAWLYHCGAMPMLQHVAMGMYGAVVVDPPGRPAVARSYVMVQSGLYLGPGGGLPSMDHLLAAEPDRSAFNGYTDQYARAPLHVRVGERVRVWVVDAGPSEASSFHVVGTQFDTVYKEGGYLLRPGAGHGGAQALDLQPGEGGFVEFTLPAPGRYPFVSHRLADAERGARGLFIAQR